MSAKRTRVNEQIRAPRVRLIDAEGNQRGVVSIDDARAQAQAANLDLVEVSPQADPPVARLVNWGKYQYEKAKQEQQARRKAKATEVKQMRFGLKIGDHDFNIKVNRIRKFLERGHKIKLSVFFRGREIIHPELGNDLLDRVLDELSDIAVTDSKPQLTGKHLVMLIRKK